MAARMNRGAAENFALVQPLIDCATTVGRCGRDHDRLRYV